MSGTNLGTLITYNPWSVGPTMLLDDVAERFHELHVHHVAVVDGDRRVVGMLSESDLLRARQSQRAALVCAGVSDTGDPPLVFARDAMSRQVCSISPSDDFRAPLAIILDRRIHALPVIDDGRLVGLITSRDFLREFSYGDLPGARDPITSLLPSTPPNSLAPDATLDEAIIAMQDAGASCLVVAQGECPLGVVSQRDIVREKCREQEHAEFHPEMPLNSTIALAMHNSPSIRSGQRLFEAAAAMIEQGLPAVTVVNQSNRLLGIITEDDLLRVLYDALA